MTYPLTGLRQASGFPSLIDSIIADLDRRVTALATVPPSGGVVPVGGPVGGPSGYTTMLVNDSFGSNGASKLSPGTSTPNPANYTARTQFHTTTQPDSSYGVNGQGWDLWQAVYGAAPGDRVNVVMQTDHIEISPSTTFSGATTGTTGANFMVSHFEAIPSVTTSYYYEVRIQTGRGKSTDTWPAFWLQQGNESTGSQGSGNGVVEVDLMENYNDLAFGSLSTANGYTDYWTTTIHDETGGSLTTDGSVTTLTDPLDITNTWHVEGFEWTANSSGQFTVNVYLNGTLKKTITSAASARTGHTPYCILMGWNPGTSTAAPSPNIMSIDYVRVWSKTISAPPPSSSPLPVGGPAGYSKIIVNDSFGSNGSAKLSPGTSTANPANYTSRSQFHTATQPDSSYGVNGQGWDLWAAVYGLGAGDYVNVVMQSDHIEISPSTSFVGTTTGTTQANFMVSHFEAIPTTAKSYYYEVRMQTGRGQFADTWPAFWLQTGNESTQSQGSGTGVVEVDLMETYSDLAFGSLHTANGYTDYIQTTIHDSNSGGTLSTDGSVTTKTDPLDVTATWHVEGFEWTINSSGQFTVNVYINGVFTTTITSTDAAKTGHTPYAILMGWNPGTSTAAPAPNTMSVDYVRVWSK